MRFGKISAAMIAAAIMATSCAAMASAVASEPVACLDQLNEKQHVYFRLLTEKDEEAGLFDKMNSKLLEVCGFRITATFGDEDWIGGGMGANSQSTGWKQIEWGTNDKTIEIKDGVVEWKNDGPIFKDTDTYAHLWFQTWSGTCKSVDKIELLDKDGNALWTITQDNGTIAEGDGTYKGIWKDTDPDAASGDAEVAEEKADEAEVADPQSGTFTAEFGAQFNSALGDEWPSFSDKQVKFDYDKEATFKVDMGSEVGFGGNYIAINTDVPFVEGMSAEVTSFKLDGKEIKIGETYLNTEGINGGLRLTLLNLWNDQIETQPVDPADLPEKFQTIEIKFIVEEPDEDLVDDDIDSLEELEAALDDLSLTLDEIMEMWDMEAAVANNATFALGGKIDLIAALGFDWDKFTKVEADFSWTPGTGWCGGAGIGGGADVEGGSGWISGPEYGAANANEGVVNDGFATQTIIDLEGKTLAQIASLNEDGTISFGEMQIQKWWNCDEANAKILAIRFLDNDGNVVAELKSAGAAEVAVAPAETAVDAAVADKGNPDTGVADVAAVAGLALVAGGAFVIAKKRK